MTKIEGQILESIHRIELAQIEMKADLKRNTDDMEEHIKRTNMLEKKLSTIYKLMWVGIGAAAANLGPAVLKLVGIML